MFFIFAHLDGSVTPQHWLHAWRADPWIIAGLTMAVWAYVRGLRVLLPRRPTILPLWRRVAFFAGILVIAFALESPMDGLADTLFSAHMVQHLLLIVVAAPLLVAGAPLLPILFAFSPRVRRQIGQWFARSSIRRGIGWIASPGAAWLLHAIALWYWHIPGPYHAALESPPLHAFEHLCFLATAVLFWWPLLAPFGRRLEGLGAVIYAFTMMMQGALLGAALTFSPTPWYPAHAEGAVAWGMTPLGDQQIAGLIMWVPAGVAYVGVTVWLFVRWLEAGPRCESQVSILDKGSAEAVL